MVSFRFAAVSFTQCASHSNTTYSHGAKARMEGLAMEKMMRTITSRLKKSTPYLKEGLSFCQQARATLLQSPTSTNSLLGVMEATGVSAMVTLKSNLLQK